MVGIVPEMKDPFFSKIIIKIFMKFRTVIGLFPLYRKGGNFKAKSLAFLLLREE